ncbi:glucose dehydrogenase [FAD, quinone]-like [Danaus plexippus]|uniref:glucose dehydrogenase [FAD, quinone]-like n=1 Tax=Danaus plexippus TaxID=13037 RepID=UPI002AAF5783|nr:glucose dehydrogenase [FAD, quinone]-like [Danaus plexippus]
MRRLIYTALLLNTLLYTKAIDIYEEDDSVDVENGPYDIPNNIENNANVRSFRNSRILWPYPLNNKSDPIKGNEEPSSDENVLHLSKLKNGNRKARFGYWSYPQSPIVDIMMQTVASNYNPTNANDPFDFLRDSYPLPKGYNEPLNEYDYVIVGAGSSGSVLAARLTEDKPRASVLLIEAGKPEMLLSDIPALTQYLQQTDYVWPYTMEHQPGVCMGSEEQRCYAPRGKAIGGTSVTNSMFYTRGRPQDWDRIAADGNFGWSYEEVLKYYMKSERSELKKYRDQPYRGRDGELTVENVPFKTGLVEAFLAAGRMLGHPTIDYNAPDQLGFGYVQTITNRGHRLSAAKAFLHRHKGRKNLHILSEAKATKVIIDPQTKKVSGVEYIKNNIKHRVNCRREVILSAGPIGSPQLLMLSGIGPKEHLQTLGIPVVMDLKVGRTLYDHIGFPGVIFKLKSTNASLLEPKVATLPNLMQWLQFGDGLLASPGGVEAIGYLKTALSEDPELVPDIELLSMGGSITQDSGGAIRRSMRISENTYARAFHTLNGMDTWQAIPTLLYPRSKGYMELRDTSPFSHPKLYGNYLTDPKDLATLREAVKHIIQLGESQPFKKYDATLHLPQYPTCSTYPLGSDAYWECAIRTLIVSFHEPIGTCKMGPSNDFEAVVDNNLRVYGIEGLRVADASVIPRPIGARTNVPEIMIGEKAADLIRNTWSNNV